MVRLLDEDPNLARELDAFSASIARAAVLVRVETVQQGGWHPVRLAEAFAILILDGFVLRSVDLGGPGCTELLGRGDLLDPWSRLEGEPTVPLRLEWHVLEPARLAHLDGTVAAAMARWPSLGGRVMDRALGQAHVLATHLAIASLPGLELRLYVLLWHLADRFGRVERHGTTVPIRLTHETLARLVAARRPSVTTALTHLRKRELVVSRADGSWLVRGDPQLEIARMRAVRQARHSGLAARQLTAAGALR